MKTERVLSRKNSAAASAWCSPRTILFLPLLGAFLLVGWTFSTSGVVSSSFDGWQEQNADIPQSSSSSASQVRYFSIAQNETSTWNVDQNPAAVQWTLEATTEDTAKLAQGPFNELQRFVQNQGKHTPAARFIELLRTELHGQPHWEARRYWACRQKKWGLCIGGYRNAPPNGTNSSTKNNDVDEMRAYLPLLPQTDNSTVFRMRRFRDSKNTIANLGTNMACLPLFLAGASIDVRTGMVVELGPFAGFSSKCLAYGVLAAFQRAEEQGLVERNSTMIMAPRLVSMDKFSGQGNYNAITRNERWIIKTFPDFNETNTDFLPLWQQTVQYVYPKATAARGYIDRTTLNDAKMKKDFGVSSIHVLVADSIKATRAFHSQLEGVTVEAGTVLFLMDILLSSTVMHQVWSCLRKDYLLPVYISWRTEHMAFVVTKTFSISQQSDIYQCYVDTAADFANRTKIMNARLKQDLTFLTGLTPNASAHELYNPELLDFMYYQMTEKMNTTAKKLSRDLAKIGRGFFG